MTIFTRVLALSLTMAACGLLNACSPQAANAPGPATRTVGTHPVSSLDIVPLTVTSGDRVHRFDVEIARTAQEQSKGLMFRTELGPDEGMIFPRNPPGIASFWMKNTPLALDIIFVGTDGRILNIAPNTVPYSTDQVTAAGMTGLVLELIGGRAAELGIEPGDRVEWQDR